MTIVNEIMISSLSEKLSKEIASSLISYGVPCDNVLEEEAGVPLYYFDGGVSIFLIKDFVLTDAIAFEEARIPFLFKGGASLIIKLNDCDIAIPDDRYGWLRPIGGTAKASEALSLSDTAIREGVVEELGVYSADCKVRYIPTGARIIPNDLVEINNTWGFTPDEVRFIGKTTTNHQLNEANRLIEAVVTWRIPLNAKDLIILHQEDWFIGGRSGITPVGINDAGEIVGIFSGRQGYFSLPFHKLHPILAARNDNNG